MPWTNKQFRFLMSSGSPLTDVQKTKDKNEAHANPSMIHMPERATHALKTIRSIHRGK